MSNTGYTPTLLVTSCPLLVEELTEFLAFDFNAEAVVRVPKHGADPNTQSLCERTPLRRASMARMRMLETAKVRLLVRVGARSRRRRREDGMMLCSCCGSTEVRRTRQSAKLCSHWMMLL
jgi:hypothetical protein